MTDRSKPRVVQSCECPMSCFYNMVFFACVVPWTYYHCGSSENMCSYEWSWWTDGVDAKVVYPSLSLDPPASNACLPHAHAQTQFLLCLRPPSIPFLNIKTQKKLTKINFSTTNFKCNQSHGFIESFLVTIVNLFAAEPAWLLVFEIWICIFTGWFFWFFLAACH